MKVKDILQYLDSFAPFDTCEEWDNCGLLVGNQNGNADVVLVSLDVTDEVLKKAKEQNAGLIVAHHPIILGGVTCILSDSLIYKAVKSGISVIGFHTCFDNAKEGVSCILAKVLGLELIAQNQEYPSLVTGERQYKNAADLVADINQTLKTDAEYIDSGKPIKKIAVCCGSGGSFLNVALDTGADAFVTGECKYHNFLIAGEMGITLIAAGHYETEAPCVPVLSNRIKTRFPNIEVITHNEKPPIVTL